MPTVRPRSRALARAVLLTILALGAPLDAARSSARADVTPELQKGINAAIEKGTKWLKSQRSGDGMFGGLFLNNVERHQIGLGSLCGLALLATGELKNDPGMLQTLAALKKQDALEINTRTTYGSACLIMFITEMFRPEMKPDKDAGHYAKPKAKEPCGLPKEMAEWVQELATFLAEKQLDDGLWRYPYSPPGDLSNTQYALLGLRAARDCGARIPASVFLKVLERVLAAQMTDGLKHARVIAGGNKPGERDYSVGNDKARGFGYLAAPGGVGDIITGAMTTAGIATLAICRDALLKPERFSTYTDELDRKVQTAVQDGFAWLDLNWAVDRNPPASAPAWHHYYLYGLERACVFGGRDRIGKHDWYAEGAAVLVAKQQANGKWSTGAIGAKELDPSDICDTAFALLFLKRATRPLSPVPVPVVTTGG